MEFSEKFLHSSYAVSIMVLCTSLLLRISNYLDFGADSTFAFMGSVGVLLLILGLFKFSRGLGFGLTLAGIVSVLWGSRPLWHKISDELRFVAALVVLIIIVYALYRMMSQNKGK